MNRPLLRTSCLLLALMLAVASAAFSMRAAGPILHLFAVALAANLVAMINVDGGAIKRHKPIHLVFAVAGFAGHGVRRSVL